MDEESKGQRSTRAAAEGYCRSSHRAGGSRPPPPPAQGGKRAGKLKATTGADFATFGKLRKLAKEMKKGYVVLQESGAGDLMLDRFDRVLAAIEKKIDSYFEDKVYREGK